MTRTRIDAWADRATAGAFYALIYFLPISTALVEIWSSVIITIFFLRRIGGVGRLRLRPPSDPVTTAAAVFLGVNFLATVFSQVPALSVRGFVGKVVQEVVLLAAFRETMARPRRMKRFFGILSVSFTLMVADALAQKVFGRGFVHGQVPAGGRVVAAFGHPNDFAGYLVMLLPVPLALARGWGRPILRGGCALLFLGGLASLGWTFSRAGWLGACLGIFVSERLAGRRVWRLLALFLAFGLVFGPALVRTRNVSFLSDNALGISFAHPNGVRPVAPVWSREGLRWRGERIVREIGRFSGMGRRNFWGEALGLIRRHPILGAGVNTYATVGARLYPEWEGYYPHNCYLHLAGEIGLAGLAAFAWVVAAVWRAAARARRRLDDPFLAALLPASMGGLAGFLLHSVFDTNFFSVRLGALLWLVLGVLAAFARMQPEETGT